MKFIEDFNKGEQDCKAGLPAQRNQTKEYNRGYADQYALEQSQSARSTTK